MTACPADPLAVSCDHCGAQPGQRCMMISDWTRKPHACRALLALILAAHADPSLNEHFPQRNQCLVCGVPGLPQRHRMVNAVAGHLSAGEDAETIAGELDLTAAAVLAVGEWAERWPGAWR